MKITTARNWYGEGSGIVIKTDDYLIDLYWASKFMLGIYCVPEGYIVSLCWLRCEITEDDINYWEYM